MKIPVVFGKDRRVQTSIITVSGFIFLMHYVPLGLMPSRCQIAASSSLATTTLTLDGSLNNMRLTQLLMCGERPTDRGNAIKIGTSRESTIWVSDPVSS